MRAFNRAAPDYEAAARLARQVRADLLDRLQFFPLKPAQVLDLGAYFRPLWRWKWVVVLVVAVAAAGTYFLESREPKRYVSSTSVLIQDGR